MNHEINQLIKYALDKQLISSNETDYSVNLLLDLLKEDYFEYEQINETFELATDILESILDKAVQKGLIEDNITSRDLFDTKIMNCIMPRPNTVVTKFKELAAKDSKQATDYYYDLSIASNYIRKSRTDKNIKFTHNYKYGDIQITINLSKPEKDPKEIAKAKLIKSSGYPKCLLCKENVGYSGNLNHPARQTHRIIDLKLDGDNYYFQYSPYVYYNEHCIIFNKEHIDMVINHDTFRHLFSFIEQFPHYMLGSNADLPIVGGSILTHDHYQGGCHHFPIEDAPVIETYQTNKYPNTTIELIKWPLSSIRLTAANYQELIALSDEILNKWINYSDESLDIISHTNNIRHNTITPIARRKGNDYQIDLVLRNNRTSDLHPLGIFHPHSVNHHIKKENIGLIEVMGLAVLPARLVGELDLIKECLKGNDQLENHPDLLKHQEWFNYLKQQEYSNIDIFIEQEVTKKFVSVLEDAGVYKMDKLGKEGFKKFIESVINDD